MRVLVLIYFIAISQAFAQDKKILVKFSGIEFEFLGLESKIDMGTILNDSIVFDADLGSEFEGSLIRVKSEDYEGIKIYQAYETSLSISDGGGAHCDFLNWKHYKSSWRDIPSSSDGFVILKYSEEESIMFPKVSMNEVKKLVMTNCAEKFWTGLKNVKTVNDSPCSVGISAYIIRAEGFQKKTKAKKTWFIRIWNPMGC